MSLCGRGLFAVYRNTIFSLRKVNAKTDFVADGRHALNFPRNRAVNIMIRFYESTSEKEVRLKHDLMEKTNVVYQLSPVDMKAFTLTSAVSPYNARQWRVVEARVRRKGSGEADKL